MKLSVKKFSKKSLSLLIALIMVFSTMPFTAVTAQAAVSLYNDRHGIVTNGNQSRWKNNRFNIVNDGESNNMSAGVLHFDLTDYMNKKISNVTFNVAIESTSADTQIQYMNYYYSTTLKKDSTWLVAGGKETINAGIGYGTGTTGVDTVLDNLGHNGGLLARTARTATTGSFDVTNTIKGLIEQRCKDLYIIVMHSNAGGTGSGSGWSDTTVNPASIYFSIDSSDYDFNSVSGNKEYIEANIDNFAMPTAQSVTCNGTNLNLSNVLYTSNTYLDNSLTEFSLNEKLDDTKMSAKLMSPSNRIVYMYTGNKSIVKVPLIFEAQKNSTVLQRYKINYVCSASSNWTIDNENWIRTTAYNKWDTNSAGTRDGEYYISSSLTHNVTNFDANNRSEGVDGITDFRNLVTYNGTLSFSNNYFIISELPKVDMSFDGFCYWTSGFWGTTPNYSYQNNITKNTTGLGKALSTISLANTASYSVIDFSGYNALVSNNTMKNKYNTVKANETNYTDDSLLAYYKAVANLVKFKVASYDLSTDSGVSSCAKELATVVSAYNTANNGLKSRTYTVTFTRTSLVDFTQDDIIATVEIKPNTAIADNSDINMPALSKAVYDSNNQHWEYYWQNTANSTEFTSSTVVNSDITVKELRRRRGCTYNPDDATCMSKARCSVCKEPVGDLKPHSYTKETFVDSVGNNNSYTKYTCTMCGQEDETVKARDYTDQSEYWNIYRNILAQANDKIAENDATNGAKYTSESINDLKDAIARVKEVGEKTKSQSYIENENKTLQEAITALDLNQYSITFNVVDELGDKSKAVSTATVDYGTHNTLVLPEEYKDYVVTSWKRNINNADSIVGASSRELQVIVKSEAVYSVHVKKTNQEVDNRNAVITLNNKSGNVADIGYVPMNQDGTATTAMVTVDTEGGTIKIGNTTLTAPKYSFYDLERFEIDGNRVASGQTITINSKMVIIPVYTPSRTVTITRATGSNFLINGDDVGSVQVEWNKKIVMTYNGTVPEGQVVIWKDGKGNILAQGTTYSFYSNSNVTISATVEASAPTAPTASIGYFDYDSALNKVTVVNNFFVPDGMTATKAGVILSTKSTLATMTNEERVNFLKDQTTGRFEGTEEKFSGTDTNKNQIRISVSRTATTSFTMYALAYVVVGDKTYYAPTVRSITYQASTTA